MDRLPSPRAVLPMSDAASSRSATSATLSLSEMARGDESAPPLRVRLGESGKMDSVEGR